VGDGFGFGEGLGVGEGFGDGVGEGVGERVGEPSGVGEPSDVGETSGVAEASDAGDVSGEAVGAGQGRNRRCPPRGLMARNSFRPSPCPSPRNTGRGDALRRCAVNPLSPLAGRGLG